jgi:hypothetical protein
MDEHSYNGKGGYCVSCGKPEYSCEGAKRDSQRLDKMLQVLVTQPNSKGDEQ